MAFFKPTPLPEKFNICFVTKKFPYPGREEDENYLWPIARGLARRGHSVVVLSWQNPRKKAEIVSGNVKAYFLGESRGSSRRNFPQMALEKFEQLHQQNPFHIVHGLDDSAQLIGQNRKRLNIVMTYDVSATQMSQLFSILGMAQETLGGLLSTGFALAYKFLTTYLSTDRALLNTADGIFVTTPMQRIMLERYYMYPELKTFIVPYGMDYIETRLFPKSEELRSQLGLPAASQNILTFTDMSELGEVLNLLKAFQRVVVKKPNARLIIMGHGPLKKAIEYEMLNLALGSKVIFTGTVPNEKVTDYIALADLYVNLSSRTTGFEPTMLGAMAQKKVVIGSELSPISTVITDGLDGFLVRPADISTLTDLMAALFSGNFRSREANKSMEEIGEHAREKVLNLFNVDKMVEQMLLAFQQILRRTGRRWRPTPGKPSDIATSPPPLV